MKTTIGLLCSGEIGLHCLKKTHQHIIPQFVFTDKSSSGIIEYADNMHIPLFIGNPRNERSLVFLKKFKTDLIFSINYLFIVNQNILSHPQKNAINFHGSLLPKYRGRTPHVWAIINGEKKTGITAHFMEEGCDTGDIVLQENISIDPTSTGADILKIYKKKYPAMILKILDLIEKNNIIRVKQEEDKATYFGKRSPEDGQIDWNWQKERILNWVRALSKPYPGAFTYYNSQKIIINSVEFSDKGFHQDDVNGKILECIDHIVVKTSNGAIILKDIEIIGSVNFKKGEEFKCLTLR